MRHLALFGLTALLLPGQPAAQAAQRPPEIRVELNNNPRFVTQLQRRPQGDGWTMSNVPSLAVEGAGFADGPTRVTIDAGGLRLGARDVRIAQSRFHEEFELAEPLRPPLVLEIRVGSQEYVVRPALTRVSGDARYYDGAPVPRPVISAMDGMQALGNEQGRFEIWLSDPQRGVGIFPYEYGVGALEHWLWEVPAGAGVAEIAIAARIGGLEVYELGAWVSAKGGNDQIFVHFVPMSLARINETLRDGGAIRDGTREMWPTLDSAEVTIYLDDTPVPLLSLQEFRDPLPEGWRPGYLAVIPARDYAGRALRVEITDTVTIEGREIRERGSGHFLGFLTRDGWDRM